MPPATTITPALLGSRALLGIYNQQMNVQKAPAWVSLVSQEINGTMDDDQHVWLDSIPDMREWIGDRQVNTFLLNSVIIKTKPFESTIEFKRKQRRADTSSQIENRIRNHVSAGIIKPAQLLTGLIINGESSLCYDGQFFFDTDHAEGQSGSQSNDLTFAAATGVIPTVGEMSDAILKSIEAILNFKDDKGNPLNEMTNQFTVMVPAGLLGVGIGAVKNDFVAGGASNTLVGGDFGINVVANPRLSAANKFYTFASGMVKPFILQVEEPLRVSSKAEGSEYEHDTNKHQFGLEWHGNVGYGLWQGSTLTTFT